MPKSIYRFSQACEKIGISKSTYLRYVKDGIFSDVQKDGRGWRVFQDDDIKKIKKILEQKHLIL